MKSPNRIPSILALLALGLMVSLPRWGVAGVTLGNNIILSNSTKGAYAPAAASSTDGSYLIVWTESGRIMGEVLAPDGSVTKSAFALSSPSNTNTIEDDSPVVVFNPQTDQYLVVYRRVDSTTSPKSPYGLYAWLLDTSGAKLGKEIRVTEDDAVGASKQSLALEVDPTTGRFLLVWDSIYVVSGSPEIVGMRLGTDGRPIGNGSATVLTGLLAGTANSVSNGQKPSLAYGDQEFLVTFQVSSPTAANGMDIFAERIAADTAVTPSSLSSSSIKGVFEVYTGAGDQSRPRVAYNTSSFNYAVIWKDQRNGGSAIYGNRVKSEKPIIKEMLLAGSASAATLVYSYDQDRFFLCWVGSPTRTLWCRYFSRGPADRLASELGQVFAISEKSNVNAALSPVFAVGGDTVHALGVWSTSTGIPDVSAQLVDISYRFTTIRTPVIAGPAHIKAGKELTYTIQVQNAGTSPAQQVALTFNSSLPGHVSGVSASFGENGSCDQPVIDVDGVSGVSRVGVVCQLGEISPPPLAPPTVTVRMTPEPDRQSLGLVSSAVQVAWENRGSSVKDVRATRVTKVLYGGDLVLTSFDDGLTVASGARLPVSWELREAVNTGERQFAVAFSLDNGVTWSNKVDGNAVETLLSANDFGYAIADAIVPTPRRNTPKCLLRVVGEANDAGKFPLGSVRSRVPFKIEVLRLDSPDGGSHVATGEMVPIAWEVNATAAPVAHVRLEYSIDKGIHWKRMSEQDLDGASRTFDWLVPPIRSNTKNALIRVSLLDAGNKSLGVDVSDAVFGIDVVTLNAPNGGESLNGGEVFDVTWSTNSVLGEPFTVRLRYSINNGVSWTTIDEIAASAGSSYRWTLPRLAKTATKALVKVDLLDSQGKVLVSDSTDDAFTILRSQ